MPIRRPDDPKSAIQKLRDAIFVDTADGLNLDNVAANLGFKRRPLGWANHDLFRAVVRKLAVTPHTPKLALYILCELVLGPAVTKLATLNAGQGSFAELTGTNVEPFVITAGSNLLKIKVNDLDPVIVTLTVGGAVTADTVVSDINSVDSLLVTAYNESGAIKLVAGSSVKGLPSFIELQTVLSNAYTVLGFSTLSQFGFDDAGEGTKIIRLDSSYLLADIFPQITKELVIDEHSPVEERLSYRFLDPIDNLMDLSENFEYRHKKYLPYAGSEIAIRVSVGSTTIQIFNNTGFPVIAAPVNGVQENPLAILINRGGKTEEIVQVIQTVGVLFILAEGTQHEHLVNESVEIAFLPAIEPTLNVYHPSGMIELFVDDSSIFPKEDFTVIVERGTDREETFFVSINDKTNNRLVLSNPATTTFGHEIGVKVEPAQLQIKGCGWCIEETRASKELQIVVPRDCLNEDGFSGGYLREEIEPADLTAETGIAPVDLIIDAVLGESQVSIDTAEIHKLVGGPDSPPGPRTQDFVDLFAINRVVEITDDLGNYEINYAIKFKEKARLILPPNGYSYTLGDTLLYFDSVIGFKDIALPFDITLNRTKSNAETVTVTAISFSNNTMTIGGGIGNYHCNYRDSLVLATLGDIFETAEWFTRQTIVLANPLQFAYMTGDNAKINILNTPNFLYDSSSSDSFGNMPPLEADNLQDGGFLPEGGAQTPSNGKWWGYYLYNSPDTIPRKITTELASGVSIFHPEAVRAIPAPTEILGYCTDINGNGFIAGNVPSGKNFIVLLDGRLWPPLAGDGVAPYPYPASLSRGTSRQEIVEITEIKRLPAGLPTIRSVDYSVYQPSVVSLLSATAKEHKGRLNTRGDFAKLIVEQLILDDATFFPTDKNWAIFDFGLPSEESFEYERRDGNVLILDDHEFEFQHPATLLPYSYNYDDPAFMVITSGQNSISAALKDHFFRLNGYDHPIYLEGGLLAQLIGFRDYAGILEYIRTAGVKVSLIISDTNPACSAVPYLKPTRTYSQLINLVGSEGDEYTVLEGGTYVYSEIINEWIRKEAYDLSDPNIELLGKIDGNVTPSAETPAWVNNISGGSITVTGANRVQYDTTASVTFPGFFVARADSQLTTIKTGPRFIQGFFLVTFIGSVDGQLAHMVRFRDGTKDVTLNLAHVASGNELRLVDHVNTAIGVVNTAENVLSLKWVEMLMDPVGDCSVWVDNKANPCLITPYASFPATTFNDIIIGDRSGTLNQNVIMEIFNVKAFSLT